MSVIQKMPFVILGFVLGPTFGGFALFCLSALGADVGAAKWPLVNLSVLSWLVAGILTMVYLFMSLFLNVKRSDG